MVLSQEIPTSKIPFFVIALILNSLLFFGKTPNLLFTCFLFYRILSNTLEFTTAWSDFCTEISQPTPTTGQYTNSDKPTVSGDTYILKCTFTSCTDSDGGAINLKGSYLLVEFSAFYQCNALNNGGCVYVTSSFCVINCVCCFKCYADSQGQSIWTEIDPSSNNSVIQSSICSNSQTPKGSAPIYMLSGDQNCSSVNLSNNYVSDRYSAIYYNYGSLDQLIVEYCSIKSNKAEGDTCIGLWSNGQSYKVEKSNIIQNTQDNGDSGTFYCEKPTEIIDCCILENTGGQLFYCESGWSGSITVKNCTLPSFFNHNAGVTTISAFASKSFIHGFTLTESGTYCEAGQDSVGDLTPIPQQTPFPTLTETPIIVYRDRYITCDKGFAKYHLGYFSYCSVFICGFT